MKKVFVLFIAMMMVILLASCGKQNQTFKFTLDEENSYSKRDGIVFAYLFEDPDRQLENSEIKYQLTKNDDAKTVVNSGTLDKTGTEKSISSLDNATKYLLTITTSFNNKEVRFVSEKEYSTLEAGNDEAHPLLITSVADLKDIVKVDNTAHYKLAVDLDLEGAEISPLFTTKYFSGSFDGDGHVIKNFKLGTETNTYSYLTTYTGFFGGIAEGGVVKNLTFENASLYVKRSSSSQTFFAVVAGKNAGRIENVTVKDSTLNVTGSSQNHHIAMIATILEKSGVVSNCKVENSNIKVKTQFSCFVGGIVALNDSKATATTNKNKIEDCSFTGNIEVVSSSTTNYSSNVNVRVGGIIGQNNSSVLRSTVDANIKVDVSLTSSSSTYNVLVGGIAGQNLLDGESVIVKSNAKVTMDVTALKAKNLAVGALVGLNGGTNQKSGALVVDSKALAKEEWLVNCMDNLHLGAIGHDKNATTELELETINATINKYYSATSEEPQKVQKATLTKDNYTVSEETVNGLVLVIALNEGTYDIVELVGEEYQVTDTNLNKLAKNQEVTIRITLPAGHAVSVINVNEEASELALTDITGEASGYIGVITYTVSDNTTLEFVVTHVA